MPVVPVDFAGAVVDVAVPGRSGLAGVSMAGFRGRAQRPVEMQMVPYPAVTIFFDFGDVRLVDDVSGERRSGSAVVGMGQGKIRGSGRDVDLLQVRMSPVLAYAVTGCAESGNSIVGLDELWGRAAGRIQEQLHAAASWDARFAIVQAALLRGCLAGRAVDPEVAYCWRRMERDRGRVRIEHLAAEVGWSRKRLWSRFRFQIGRTPKHAAMLTRFDDVAHRLAAGRAAATVAAECGFADQAHLVRDVTAFSGMTPSAVARAPWLTVDPVAWPGQTPLR